MACQTKNIGTYDDKDEEKPSKALDEGTICKNVFNSYLNNLFVR